MGPEVRGPRPAEDLLEGRREGVGERARVNLGRLLKKHTPRGGVFHVSSVPAFPLFSTNSLPELLTNSQ